MRISMTKSGSGTRRSRMVALRAEKPRELIEEVRREAKEANAARRSRLNGTRMANPPDRPKKRGRTHQAEDDRDNCSTGSR